MNLVLQPCANKLATSHFQQTIVNEKLNLNAIKPYLSKRDYDRLKNIYGDSHIKIWGVVPSAKGKWNKVQIGDISLFTGNKEIFAYGTICYKFHNPTLAMHLWGKDDTGDTWEYIYFLITISKVHISYVDFNNAVGYKENYKIQGLNVLDDKKTNRFLNIFPIQSDTFVPEVAESEYVEIVNNKFQSSDDLDGKSLTSHRKEQAFLRRSLFGNKTTDKCAICGKEYPIGFLCCSHIKKRCLCTTEEKIDYKNIVVPMCKFGCDDLYEKGYIGVCDGQVVAIKYAQNSVVDSYINSIKGKSVARFSEDNKKYFEAHLEINGFQQNSNK